MKTRVILALLFPIALALPSQARAATTTCYTISGQSWCNLSLPSGANRAVAIGDGRGAALWIITDQPNGSSDPNNNKIYYINSADWTQVPGGALQLTVAADGSVWVVRDDGSIWKFNGIGFYQPTGMSGACGRSIAVGSSTNVYATSCSNCAGSDCQVNHYNGSAWSYTGAYAASVGPPASGKAAWLTTSTGCISYYDGSSWTSTGCTVGNSQVSGEDDGTSYGANFFNSSNNHWYHRNSSGTGWTDALTLAVTVAKMSSFTLEFIDAYGGGVWWMN